MHRRKETELGFEKVDVRVRCVQAASVCVANCTRFGPFSKRNDNSKGLQTLDYRRALLDFIQGTLPLAREDRSLSLQQRRVMNSSPACGSCVFRIIAANLHCKSKPRPQDSPDVGGLFLALTLAPRAPSSGQ